MEISGVILVASYSRAFELDLGQGHHRGSKNTREPQLASLGEETVTPTIGDGMGHKCMRHACDHSPHKGMHHAHSRIRSILGQGHHTSLISVPEIAWMELFNSAPTETACEGWLTKCMCLQPTKLGSPSALCPGRAPPRLPGPHPHLSAVTLREEPPLLCTVPSLENLPHLVTYQFHTRHNLLGGIRRYVNKKKLKKVVKS